MEQMSESETRIGG